MDHKKSKTSFLRTEKYRFTNHGKKNPHSRFTQRKNAHSCITKKVKGTLNDGIKLIKLDAEGDFNGKWWGGG